MPEERKRLPTWVHHMVVAVTIGAPLAMLLPPRRIDKRFMFLSGAFTLSSNQLAMDYTGQSLMGRVFSRFTDVVSPGMTDKAQATKAALAREKEQRRQQRQSQQQQPPPKEEEGMLKKIWMGGEKEDWKQQRAEQDRKALEEGKGYSDLIMEQVWEVFGKGGGSKGA